MYSEKIKNTPIDYNTVKEVIDSFGLPEFKQATIREVVTMSQQIEQKSGQRFIHMEMGVPGLPPEVIGVKAEIEALQRGVASKYPMLPGVECLKNEASRFIKAFVNVDVSPKCCIPTSGSMQGIYAAFLVSGQCDPKKKDTVLFIDPGFPVQKDQCKVLGLKYETFDMFDYRGDRLIEKVESYLKKGNICNIIYSNPNNPSWVCLTDSELKGIGQLATQYNTIIIEDLAYFGMDFRQDLSLPFQPPYQPSVAHYTDNYILMISGSKAFSYAGQRIGLAIINDKLYTRFYQELADRYTVGEFGNVYVNRVLYTLSSGTAHSAQYALAAMLKAANDGAYNFLQAVREYGRRAARLKKIFLANGFHIVYNDDLGEPVGDGFYFTVGYPGMTGGDLMYELMFYGVSAICLDTTGSQQQGLRICTSFIQDDQYELLENRMKIFHEDHPTN